MTAPAPHRCPLQHEGCRSEACAEEAGVLAHQAAQRAKGIEPKPLPPLPTYTADDALRDGACIQKLAQYGKRVALVWTPAKDSPEREQRVVIGRSIDEVLGVFARQAEIRFRRPA